GPRGRASVDLLGTGPQFAHAGGPLLRHFSSAQLESQQALALPEPVAQQIGASLLQPIEVQVGTRVTTTLLGATLQEADIGGLVHSPVAVAPVAYAQTLAGTGERVMRIFVRTAAGREPQVAGALRRLAGGRLNVVPADFDSTLFAKASGPANQGAELFSAISALVGFMFAFNALLITARLRRDLIGELRRHGATRAMTIQTLLFDALVLGAFGCALGLALGDLLSAALFRTEPGYLAYAFPVGSQRIVTWQSAAIAVGAGMAAACVGVLAPLRGALARPLRRRALARSGLAPVQAAVGLACLAATTAILALRPASAVLGTVTLMVALLALLPFLFDALIGAFERAQRPLRSAATRLAVIELRTPATRTRSLAIAATGAMAVFGAVALRGAGGNLQGGMDRVAADVNGSARVWVSVAGSSNTLSTTPFSLPPATLSRLRALPVVASLGVYRGGFLNLGARRVWIIAPPSQWAKPLPASQLLTGDLTTAEARLRAGGWAAISEAIASERHLRIGDSFALPSPVPTTFRVAALTTNVGWPPGALVISSRDYARAWGSSDASALNLQLRPGTSPAAAADEIRAVLGRSSGLTVQTAAQREAAWRASSRQGLSRVSQISLLVLIAAVLATAGAMGAMIWQRRRQLAYLKRQGYHRGVLWRALLYESALLLGAGCSIGALFGLYGQILLSHALASVTGFPVVFSVGPLVALRSVALVSLAAAAIVAAPGYLAARVAPSVKPG
ncbi:MAG: ABC transporter permease, partial [Solirubrobacterales bacterium]|nr:ABC transporter permease [Solirubrobacterales bacterium]